MSIRLNRRRPVPREVDPVRDPGHDWNRRDTIRAVVGTLVVIAWIVLCLLLR